MHRLPALLLAALAASLPCAASAQTAATLTPIAPQTYLVHDPAGNAVVAFSKGGTVLVGPQTIAAQPALRRAIERAAPAPVRFVVITASPALETNRDAGWGRAGATVIAEEHAAARMASGMKPGENGVATTPSLGFSEVQQIHVGDEDVHVVKQKPGNSNADVSAHFETAGVVFLGNAYIADGYPTVDEAHGGTFDGLVETAAKFMTWPAKTKLVPGRGNVSAPADLRAYHDMLTGIRDRVKALRRSGRSLAAILAAHPTAPYDARWGRIAPAAGDALVTACFHSLATPSAAK